MKSIKRPHLVEIKNLPNPPKVVKLALESICLLLGEPTTDWRAIRGILMRENFIPTIVNFSTDDIRQASSSLCSVTVHADVHAIMCFTLSCAVTRIVPG